MLFHVKADYFAACAWGWQPYRHLWADCLDSVGSLTSQPYRPPRPVTRDSFAFFYYNMISMQLVFLVGM
jgi:hypothetical protein